MENNKLQTKKIMETYELNGKKYPIEGYCNVVNSKGEATGRIPIVALPMMSDYHWFLACLDSRLRKPHIYETENVEDVKKYIKTWLVEHTTTDAYNKYIKKYPHCFEYVFGDIAYIQ